MHVWGRMNVQYAKSDLSIGYFLVLLGLLCPAVRTGQAWLWQDVDYLLSRKTNPDVKGDPLGAALAQWGKRAVLQPQGCGFDPRSPH